MGAEHPHPGGAHRQRLIVALAIAVVILVVEVVGSVISSSLALLADAGHMFTDVAGTLLAVLAVTFAARPATEKRTYGYYRLEILAAVINAVLLFGIAIFILWQAVLRWSSPEDVAGSQMLVFAIIGLIGNAIALAVLHGGQRESLNVRGAYLEALGDLLGAAAVIFAALIIVFTGWEKVDIIASVIVALMILPRTWSLLREAVDVLLEATPKGIDLTEIRTHILETPGVVATHDLHVWTLTSGMPVLSVHVLVEDDVLRRDGGHATLTALRACLANHFDVEHSTFQLELASQSMHDGHIHE